MVKFLENNHITHIISEFVILMGLIFWFKRQNCNLMSHIDDLSHRMEEQEEHIQKHEEIIKKLINTINGYSIRQTSSSNNNKKKNQNLKKIEQSSSPIIKPLSNIDDLTDNNNYLNTQGEDVELDDQITEELKELTQSDDEKN